MQVGEAHGHLVVDGQQELLPGLELLLQLLALSLGQLRCPCRGRRLSFPSKGPGLCSLFLFQPSRCDIPLFWHIYSPAQSPAAEPHVCEGAVLCSVPATRQTLRGTVFKQGWGGKTLPAQPHHLLQAGEKLQGKRSPGSLKGSFCAAL